MRTHSTAFNELLDVLIDPSFVQHVKDGSKYTFSNEKMRFFIQPSVHTPSYFRGYLSFERAVYRLAFNANTEGRLSFALCFLNKQHVPLYIKEQIQLNTVLQLLKETLLSQPLSHHQRQNLENVSFTENPDTDRFLRDVQINRLLDQRDFEGLKRFLDS